MKRIIILDNTFNYTCNTIDTILDIYLYLYNPHRFNSYEL